MPTTTKTEQESELESFRLEDVSPPTEDEKRYWQALGRLLHYFSIVELLLNLLVAHLAKVPPGVARAIYMPARVDSSIGMLNRLIDTLKIRGKVAEELRQTLQQLSVLNRTRNDLIHLGAKERSGEFLISNEVFATSRDKLRRLHMSFEDFDLIHTDLEWIMFKMMDICGMLDTKMRPSTTKLDELFVRAVRPSVRGRMGQWNYKPRRQNPLRKSRAKTSRQKPRAVKATPQ